MGGPFMVYRHSPQVDSLYRRSLSPLSALDSTSEADPVAVEWSVALALQATQKIDYLFPIFLGDADPQRNGERQTAKLWGEGSECLVAKVNQQVGTLVPEARESLSSKELLHIFNQNQGQMVGGSPEATLEFAVIKIAQMGGSISHKQAAGRKMQELQADIGRRAHLEEELKTAMIKKDNKYNAAMAEKDAAMAEKDAEKDAAMTEKDNKHNAAMVAKDAAMLEKDAAIMAAMAQVQELKAALAGTKSPD